MNNFNGRSIRLLPVVQIVFVLTVLVISAVVIAIQASLATTAELQETGSKVKSFAPTMLSTNTPSPTQELLEPTDEDNSQNSGGGNPTGNRSVCDPVRDQLMITWRQLLSVQEEKTRIQNQISAQPVSPDPNRPPTDAEYTAHQAALDQANADLDAAMAAQNAARIALDLKPGDTFCVGMW